MSEMWQYKITRYLHCGILESGVPIGANFLCYLLHPMKVETDVKTKLFIYVLGTKRPSNEDEEQIESPWESVEITEETSCNYLRFFF